MTRFELLRQTAKALLDLGHKASVRRHYPHPYEDHKVTQVILTNAGPIAVGLAWGQACGVDPATPATQLKEVPLELCRDEEDLVAYE